IAVEEGFEGDRTAWLASLKGDAGEPGTIGVNGKSAYEVALELGFEGTEEGWLESLKGEQGEAGTGTRIAGQVDTIEQLPEAVDEEEAGRAYFVGKHLYVAIAGEWIDFGDMSGPEGMGLNIRGTLPNIESLPSENNRAGDAYIINKKMFVWDSTRWAETGNVGAP